MQSAQSHPPPQGGAPPPPGPPMQSHSSGGPINGSNDMQGSHQQHSQPPQGSNMQHNQYQHQQPQQHQQYQHQQPQQQYSQQQPPPPQHQQQQQHQQRNNYPQQQMPPQGQPQQQQQQQPQGQPQHHYPHQGLNGGWQSDKDYQERRKMIAKIVHLLQQRKPNAPQEWLKKLPQMAKRLEESLYRSAKSFDEYNDASTLKHRLQQLAVNIGMKTKKMQQAQIAQQKIQGPPPPHHAQGQPPPPQQHQHKQPPPQQQQQQQQQQYRPPGTQQQPMHRPPAPQQVQPRPPPQQQQQQQPQHQQPIQQRQQPMQQQQVHPGQPQQQRLVNVSEINPIMGGPSQPPPQHNMQQQPQQQQSHQHSAPQASAPIQYQPQQQQPAAPAPGPSSQPAPGPNGHLSSSNAASSRNVSDRQQVLRHQQQRLLLLRHAAKCQHEDGRCPVTPHCAGMKRLWKHIAECKDQKCLVPHCVSSRYVLSHYHRCKDVRCPVCGPVREAIHRSHEKQKQMQALKQRHQQAVQQTQLQPNQTSQSSVPAAVAPLNQPISSQSSQIAPASGMPQLGAPGIPDQPPNKRRKTAAPGMPTASTPYQATPGGPIIQQQPAQQPLHQPSSRPMPSHPPGMTASQWQAQQQNRQPAPTSAPVPLPGRPGISTAPGIAFSNGQVITPKYTGPKPQEDHTLINCFSVAQIETHIASLNKGLQLPPAKLKTKCLDVLKVLQSHQHGWVFNSPVDPVELGLPDYFEVVKRPMDLGTIRKKLENGCYHSLEEFEEHVHLTFDNAMLYNPEGSVVYNMAEEMKTKFTQDYKVLMDQLNLEEDAKRKNGEACLLCGCEKLLFEPPVFYCNGANCPSKRIRRNSHYYVGGNNQYHWCHQCYQELKDNQTIELGDIVVKKEALTKKKNDELHEESWVQCDRCERWIHQICALFNTRQNKDQRSEYACPRCTIEERKKKGQFDPISQTPMAEDLPRTVLSEVLEDHVRRKVDEYIEKCSQAKSRKEQISVEEARKQLQMGGHITIRQVTSMDRKLEVRERMKRRYAFKNYPDEFNFRCKCIVVFQNLDGVDVILFGLYVYEHDENNPEPNKRTVYISYLDSVHYMRPRQMRTLIYHEILISYLDHVRKRGFSSAHLWACPPLKGDDYILYAKPEDQKTPKDDRLRQWYIDMLVECQRRGIVGTLTNMYDLYFSNPKNDATVVPYMDGDYFPAEVENIIKDIEEGKTGKKGSSQGKKKKGNSNDNKKAKQKKKSGRGGTRSTGLDEDALKASGFIPPGMEGKTIEEGGRDYVMVKLGETIQPMKESFIVAFLAWEGAKKENMVVPKEIQEYRDKHGIKCLSGGAKSTEKEEDDKKGDKKEDVVKTEDAPKKEEDASKERDDADKKEAVDKKEDTVMNEGESKKEAEKDDAAAVEKDGDVVMEEAGAAKKEEDVTVKDADTGKKEEKKDNGESQKATDDASKPEGDKSSSKEAEKSEGGQVSSKEAENSKGDKGSSKETEKSDGDKGSSKETEKSDGDKDSSKEAEKSEDDKDSSKEAEKSDGDKASSEIKKEEGAPESTSSDKPPADTKSEGGTADSKEKDVKVKEEDGGAKAKEGANNGPEGGTKPMEESKSSEQGEKSEAKDGEEKKDSDPAATDKDGDAKMTDATTPAETSSAPASAPNSQLTIREGKFAAMAARKRDLDGNNKEEPAEEKKDKDKEKEKEKKPSKTITVKDSKGRTVKVIDDNDEEMDCEFLNNRQAFLNLCQGNHYQFDHLRRAKHSSMMVLWHLHNRDAPKFVQQCATCSREILAGYRFHCPTCADFDQCQECVSNPKVARHPHQLKPIPVASGQQPELTEEQRKERQRSIQLHMTLLLHAATCTSTKCPSANCTKMKGLLKHGAQCQVKATGGCNVCKRIWALLQIHARQCKTSTCPVPNCMAIRERVRQLKKQQQAMDDRRRQEMNRAYRR